jgi:hypothetical protein
MNPERRNDSESSGRNEVISHWIGIWIGIVLCMGLRSCGPYRYKINLPHVSQENRWRIGVLAVGDV